MCADLTHPHRKRRGERVKLVPYVLLTVRSLLCVTRVTVCRSRGGGGMNIHL